MFELMILFSLQMPLVPLLRVPSWGLMPNLPQDSLPSVSLRPKAMPVCCIHGSAFILFLIMKFLMPSWASRSLVVYAQQASHIYKRWPEFCYFITLLYCHSSCISFCLCEKEHWIGRCIKAWTCTARLCSLCYLNFRFSFKPLPGESPPDSQHHLGSKL